jgi:hypothetical protein
MESARKKTDSARTSWSGQLIDIGGFEGQVALTLRISSSNVEGVIDVTIASHHHPIRMQGLVTGKVANRRLLLKFEPNQKEAGVAVQFAGHLFSTRRGALALCGSYSVSERQPSALMGGVLSAQQSIPLARDENVSVRQVSGDALQRRVERADTKQRRTKSRTARRGGRKAAARSAS